MENEKLKQECKHEWGTYEKGRNCLHCSDCGVELDMITRRPVESKEGKMA